MFNKRQLEVILQLLGNATFKTPEARLSVEVLEICELIQKKIGEEE
jgi:hypothetical protein